MKVRSAVAQDEEGIISLLRLMHSENGLFSLSEEKLRLWISGAFVEQPTMIIGVIGDNKIEASVGLLMNQLYYTDEWHIGDMWNYVHPDYRTTDHNKKLIEFTKSWSDQTNLTLISGVVSTQRTNAKIELYRRSFGPVIGALFLYKPESI